MHPITPSPQAHRGLVKSDPRFAAVDEAKQIVAEVMREGESAKATATTGVRHDRAGSLSSHFSLESAARDRSSVHRSPAKSPSGAIAGSPSMDSLQSNDGPRWNEEDDRSSSSADEDSVVEDNDEYYRNRERDPKLFVRQLESPQLALPARLRNSPPAFSTKAYPATRPSVLAGGPRTRSQASSRASRSSTNGADRR